MEKNKDKTEKTMSLRIVSELRKNPEGMLSYMTCVSMMMENKVLPAVFERERSRVLVEAITAAGKKKTAKDICKAFLQSEAFSNLMLLAYLEGTHHSDNVKAFLESIEKAEGGQEAAK